MQCAVYVHPRCQVLKSNGIEINPFTLDAEGLKVAISTADSLLKANREMWGDLHDFDSHPPKLDAENPLASLFYYIESHGKKRTLEHERQESWGMELDMNKLPKTLTDSAETRELSLLNDAAQFMNPAQPAAIKAEMPALVDLKNNALKMKMLGRTYCVWISRPPHSGGLGRTCSPSNVAFVKCAHPPRKSLQTLRLKHQKLTDLLDQMMVQSDAKPELKAKADEVDAAVSACEAFMKDLNRFIISVGNLKETDEFLYEPSTPTRCISSKNVRGCISDASPHREDACSR